MVSKKLNVINCHGQDRSAQRDLRKKAKMQLQRRISIILATKISGVVQYKTNLFKMVIDVIF